MWAVWPYMECTYYPSVDPVEPVCTALPDGLLPWQWDTAYPTSLQSQNKTPVCYSNNIKLIPHPTLCLKASTLTWQSRSMMSHTLSNITPASNIVTTVSSGLLSYNITLLTKASRSFSSCSCRVSSYSIACSTVWCDSLWNTLTMVTIVTVPHLPF